MKIKHIRIIIYLAAFALSGVLINQIFWINKEINVQKTRVRIQEKNINLEKEQFENVVTLALVNVRDKLLSFNKEVSGLYLEPVKQITPNYFVVSFYDTINPAVLENLLVENFKKYKIMEKFEYGIYDCFADSIIFDRYVDLSQNRMERGAVSSAITTKWNHDGHYFGIYFLDKNDTKLITSEEISSSLIISTLVILIVFSIFTYAIIIILQQKRLSEIKTDFINNMTHELKTPISTIALSSDVLLKDNISDDPERIKQYAKIIKSENNRLESQVEKVLQLAKLDKGELELKKEKVNLHQIIRDSVAVFEISIKKRNGSVLCDFHADDFILFLDRVHITNIIYNLLDNANKYSPENPAITISTNNIKNGLEVSVSDKGQGMSPDQYKQVFDKFYRVPTGSIHNVKGFGLGLYYVKLILEKHRGNILVKSDLDVGSKFTFWLPLN